MKHFKRNKYRCNTVFKSRSWSCPSGVWLKDKPALLSGFRSRSWFLLQPYPMPKIKAKSWSGFKHWSRSHDFPWSWPWSWYARSYSKF